MRLAGRIPVEPLDEDRLIKIERGVVAGAVGAAARGNGLRATRRHAGHAFAALAVVAAGIVGWALRGAPASGPVVAEPAPIQVQTDLQRSVLDIGDARIASDPATVFAVTRPAGGVLVAMTRGKLELQVDKRAGRPPLIVRAGDTDVVVVGTRFSVDYGDGRGEVDVRVTEGVVRVVHLQQETRVAAGQAWQTRSGLVANAEPANAEPASAEPARVEPARIEPARIEPARIEPARIEPARIEPVNPAARTAIGAGAPTTMPAPGAAIALGPAPGVLHDRTAAVPGAPGVATPAPPRPQAPPRPLGGSPARPRPAPQASDPVVDLRTAIRAQRVEPALDLHEPNATAAVARYYDIAAHKSGDEASQAFYSIAAVEYLRRARNTDALHTLDAYVRRFPGGKEYRAVLWLRVRILCLDKLDDRCRAAAYTYLHEAPHEPAAHVAEQLTLAE